LDELMMRMDDEKEARGSSGSFEGEDQGLHLEAVFVERVAGPISRSSANCFPNQEECTVEG
jgi:hypothetical protein